MQLTKAELVKALVKGLKLDENIFNYATIEEEISHIRQGDYIEFYKQVLKADTFGNGIKAIIKTAEQFKPVPIKDDTTTKAKQLIGLVHAMSDTIYQKHIESCISFDVLLDAASFPTTSKEDIAVLNNVAPYFNHKRLIGNINIYPNALEQLEAFKKALNKKSESLHIENNKVRQLIGGMR